MSRTVPVIKILLADDDKDDKMLFQEVLDELSLKTELITVYNGEQLMKQLNEVKSQPPDMLFLDLNMPRKNGLDCLLEIRTDKKLNNLPVIIFTTSSEPDMVNLLYKSGANYYIRKPNNYDELKNVIEKVVILVIQKKVTHPPREQFVLSMHSLLHDQ